MVSNSFINKPSWKHIECFYHALVMLYRLGEAVAELLTVTDCLPFRLFLLCHPF